MAHAERSAIEMDKYNTIQYSHPPRLLLGSAIHVNSAGIIVIMRTYVLIVLALIMY